MEIAGRVLVVNGFDSSVITVTEIILMHESEHFAFYISRSYSGITCCQI